MGNAARPVDSQRLKFAPSIDSRPSRFRLSSFSPDSRLVMMSRTPRVGNDHDFAGIVAIVFDLTGSRSWNSNRFVSACAFSRWSHYGRRRGRTRDVTFRRVCHGTCGEEGGS